MSRRGREALRSRAACAGALLLAGAAAASAQSPGGLARHAMVGAAVEALGGDSAGVRVAAVTPGFTAAGVDLRPDDVVLEVDGAPIISLIDYARAFRRWRAPGEVRLTVRRGADRLALRGPVVPRPTEEGDGIEVRYESIVSDSGDRVRTIVTRPAGAGGRLPAILLVGWLSCSSVEVPEAAGLPGWRHLLHGLTRAGYLVFRVEKPGVGDSGGPDCSELGFGREVAAYRAGLAEVRRRPDVDPARVFVFGASLGGAIAPAISAGERVSGLVVFGTFARTWYEHVLQYERRRLELAAVPFPEVDRRMQAVAALYTRYLIGGELPGEIIRSRPEYAAVWTDYPAHQFGRPARFFQEVQRSNVAAAWAGVEAPVLVLYGSNDWVMARGEHEMIVRMVNARRPGTAELAVLDKIDHSVMRYPDREHSFRGEGGAVGPEALDAMLRWLERRRRE
jgi:pimeloyl-ACP methyl ester carboxylesterase